MAQCCIGPSLAVDAVHLLSTLLFSLDHEEDPQSLSEVSRVEKRTQPRL